MPFSLIWLSRVLSDAGLKVAEEPGWLNRGNDDIGPIKGVICHHTAGSRNGNYPSLRIVRDGRADLPGPLSQLGLGRDGTYFVIAAGRANHAGKGRFGDVTTGNSSFIGIEAENVGFEDNDVRHEPWPAVQIDAYQRGVAAILKHLGLPAGNCISHKEWALPPGRKPDPHTINMNEFRAKVAGFINGTAVPRPPIPSQDRFGRPTLRRSNPSNPQFLVREVQSKIGMPADLLNGHFGPITEARIRDFQRAHALVADGIVGPASWAVLDTI